MTQFDNKHVRFFLCLQPIQKYRRYYTLYEGLYLVECCLLSKLYDEIRKTENYDLLDPTAISGSYIKKF